MRKQLRWGSLVRSHFAVHSPFSKFQIIKQEEANQTLIQNSRVEMQGGGQEAFSVSDDGYYDLGSDPEVGQYGPESVRWSLVMDETRRANADDRKDA